MAFVLSRSTHVEFLTAISLPQIYLTKIIKLIFGRWFPPPPLGRYSGLRIIAKLLPSYAHIITFSHKLNWINLYKTIHIFMRYMKSTEVMCACCNRKTDNIFVFPCLNV